jgi:hypothetical protein
MVIINAETAREAWQVSLLSLTDRSCMIAAAMCHEPEQICWAESDSVKPNPRVFDFQLCEVGSDSRYQAAARGYAYEEQERCRHHDPKSSFLDSRHRLIHFIKHDQRAWTWLCGYFEY